MVPFDFLRNNHKVQRLQTMTTLKNGKYPSNAWMNGRMISQSPGAVSKRKPEIMPHGRDKQVSRQGKPSGMSLLEAAFPTNVNIPSITGDDEASKSFITTRLAAMPGLTDTSFDLRTLASPLASTQKEEVARTKDPVFLMELSFFQSKSQVFLQQRH
ncbi:hypothetical protein NC651_016834 [Populus alba x Populus x berolinensis]|nr:hypothetical protein NC651_016834 [Populus alba x Populus x berolinensis]